jgi:NAD(P)-dependent dehydrogenase (short-subunit alcohol dehydrogenase family)
MARRQIHGLRGILTGASSGIGYALATELAHRGARLIVVARREQRLWELVESVSGASGEIFPFVGDVVDAVVQQQSIELAVEKFGGLDLLINNAGVGAMGPFAEASPERLRQVMDVNFFAAVELSRRALPALRQGVTPIIINVSSVLGHRGVPGCAEYCASKFALEGFSQSIRRAGTRGHRRAGSEPGTHQDRVL